MGLIEQLEAQIDRRVRDELASAGVKDMANERFRDALIHYANWRDRVVPPVPRKAHISDELRASPKWVEHRDALKSIIAKIEVGSGLTEHLSEGADFALEPARKRKQIPGKRRDRDLLLADWGIHHLHLGLQRRPGKNFVERSGDLLFVFFRDHDAYLVDIKPHNRWGETDLLETTVRNWPEAELLGPCFSGLVQQPPFPTPEERVRARSAGTMVLVTVGSDSYMMRGLTTAGVASDVVQEVDHLLDVLDQWRHDTVARLEDLDPRVPRGAVWRTQIEGRRCGFASGECFIGIANFRYFAH